MPLYCGPIHDIICGSVMMVAQLKSDFQLTPDAPYLAR